MLPGRRTTLAIFSLSSAYNALPFPNDNFNDNIGDNFDQLEVTQQVTSSLQDKFWPNFRATLANHLILETTINPDYAYQQVYNTFPENGNCWCHLDKTQGSKGSPQDQYDTACRNFHNCLHCGAYDENEGNRIENSGLDTEFTMDLTDVGNFSPNQNTQNFAFSSLFNYNQGENSMLIYDWACSNSNTGAANNVCKCFKEFTTQTGNMMLTDMAASEDVNNKIDFSYDSVCQKPSNNPLVDDPNYEADEDGECPDCPPEETEDSQSEDSPAADDSGETDTGSDVITNEPHAADSCCGSDAPTWFLYYSDGGKRGCCNGETYNRETQECCHGTTVGAAGNCDAIDEDASDDNASDENASDDNSSDDNASDDNASDDNTSDDNTSDEDLVIDPEPQIQSPEEPIIEDSPMDAALNLVQEVNGVTFDPTTMEWPPQPRMLACDPTDLCCNVDCGNYGSCDPNTGRCSHCSKMAFGWGDTHYTSFDGRVTDFQGHCSYLLTGTCEDGGKIDEWTPYFRLVGRQQKKAGWRNPWVTFLHGWSMEWQPVGFDGVTDVVRLNWELLENSSIVQVDDATGHGFVNLKGSHYYPNMQIQTVGAFSNTIYFGIKSEEEAKDPNSNFSVKLSFHGHRLYVHLNCEYRNQVCGMLGNFDGNRDNDWMTPQGSQISKPNGYAHPGNKPLWRATWEYGNSWQVNPSNMTLDNGASCAANNGAENQSFSCDAAKTALIKSDQWCGKLKTSPFNSCDQGVEVAFHACLYDLCMMEENEWQETLCGYLDSHEEKCKDAGNAIDQWRTESFCPLACPDGTFMTYLTRADTVECMRTTENCHLESLGGLFENFDLIILIVFFLLRPREFLPNIFKSPPHATNVVAHTQTQKENAT